MSSDRFPLGSSNLDCFADTYAAARAKFLWVAAEAGAVATTHVHPEQLGPDGGSLSVDVATFGPAHAQRALLILSGTHGTEGHAGSAAQIALMTDGALGRLPPDVRVVLVHGINPYGFAHATRTTEHNVDLNRNFIDFSGRLPRNPAYLELHDALCPAEWTEHSREEADRGIEQWIAKNGQKAWLDSIMMGQFDDPTGLNYGGRAPEWSNQVLHTIVATQLPSVRKLAFIDWHTGLGQYAEPFFLCFNDRDGPAWQRACAWWGRERIETDEGYEGGQRPPYNGLVFHGVERMIGDAELTGAVIEFGTAPIKTSFDQLRLDRWLKFASAGHDLPALARLRRGVLECFTPSDPEWRQRVIDHARQIQLQALKGLAQWN